MIDHHAVSALDAGNRSPAALLDGYILDALTNSCDPSASGCHDCNAIAEGREGWQAKVCPVMLIVGPTAAGVFFGPWPGIMINIILDLACVPKFTCNGYPQPKLIISHAFDPSRASYFIDRRMAALGRPRRAHIDGDRVPNECITTQDAVGSPLPRARFIEAGATSPNLLPASARQCRRWTGSIGPIGAVEWARHHLETAQSYQIAAID